MAQKTVRISAGYSDKITENYNSKSFSINLEMDACINGTTTEIEQASARLFLLCKKIVGQQKSVSVDNLLVDEVQPIQSQQALPQPATFTTTPTPVDSTLKMASSKQVSFIESIVKQQNIGNETLSNLLQKHANVSNVSSLTSKQASDFIKMLNA